MQFLIGCGIIEMCECMELFGGVFVVNMVLGVGFLVVVIFLVLKYYNGVYGVKLDFL